VAAESSTHAGADLVVRHGDRTWVIEIKQSSADLTSSVRHVLEAGKRLNGRPVLVVVAQPAQTDIVALSKSSGVLVTRPDEMDGLLAEIAEEPPRVSSAG